MRRHPLVLVALLATAHLASAQTNGGNPLAAIPLDAMKNAANRPPFSPSRRPPVPPAVPVADAPVIAPPPSADHLKLVGTLVGPAGASALILDTTTGNTLTLARGETVGGWRVAQIEPAGVRIEQNDRSADLALFRPDSAAPPTPAGPPARASSQPTAQTAAPLTSAPPRRPNASGQAAPPGTVAGTAAAQAAAESTFELTFGAPPPTNAPATPSAN